MADIKQQVWLIPAAVRLRNIFNYSLKLTSMQNNLVNHLLLHGNPQAGSTTDTPSLGSQ